LVSFCRSPQIEEEKSLLFDYARVPVEVVSFLSETDIVFRVVELSDSKCEMMSCKELNEVGVSRKALSGTPTILRLLIRGVAHLGNENGAIPSVFTGVEDLWALFYHSKL